MSRKKYNRNEAQKRLQEAEPWLAECNDGPMKIVRRYRKQFHLSNVTAVKDLQTFGIRFTTDRLRALHAGKTHGTKEQPLYDSDETFAYIAGYTSWGFPYGITWEEMRQIEAEEKRNSENTDDEVIEIKELPF